MTVAILVRFLTNVILFLLLARVWGPDVFGSFMYPFAIAGIAMMVIGYGFGLQLVRDISKCPEAARHLTEEAFEVELIITLFVLIASLFISFMFIHETQTGLLFWILLLASTLNAYAQFFNFAVRGLGHFSIEAGVTFWSNVALFLITVVFLLLKSSLTLVAFGFFLARGLYFFLSFRAYKRIIGTTPSWFVSKRVWSNLVRGLPFGVHMAVGALYFQSDTLIIQHFLGSEGVGLYQAGLRILMGGLMLADILSGVFLPAMSKVVAQKAVLLEQGNRLLRFTLMISVIGFTVMTLGAPWIVNLLYGTAYQGITATFPLFGLVLLLRYAAIPYGLTLTISERQSVRMFALIGALIVSIGLNFILIPKLGLNGALYISVATHLGLLIIYAGFSYHEIKSLFWSNRIFYLLFIPLLTLFSYLLPLTPTMIFLTICSICLLVLIAGVTRTEWYKLLTLTSRFRRQVKRI